MDDLDLLNGDLRGKLLDLAKISASEEKFIEYISSKLKISSNLDVKALEIVLDLTLAVVDQYGYVNFNHFEARNNSVIKNEEISVEEDKRVPELSSYDGDDEDLDDTFIFPCHIMYDDCHPELLSDYHREHFKPSRESAHIIKLPKLCEFVIEFMLDGFRNYISDLSRSPSNQSIYEQADQSDVNNGEMAPHMKVASEGESLSASNYLRFIVKLIKKVNKVCLNERRNCRILSKTGILSILLQNIDFLLKTVPEEQHIYLEPLLKFVFTLADFRISGPNLRQLFGVLKNEETDLKIVLKNLERLLSHHYRILRNIQPSKSMNFPVASKTPEEIEYDFYVANSWHWRLRSKVIECKRKRSRTDSQSQDLKLQDQTNASGSNNKQKQLSEDVESKQSPPSTGGRITPSWLECSLITPLSNISPLIHNGEVKFCCSMWMSVCGDLLVIEGSKAAQRKRAREDNGDNFDIDWNTLEGHWLRLTSRRRLVRRHKNKVVLNMKPRKRRLSAKIRRRQAYDKEDEELEEIEEKVRKSDAEMSQGHSRNGRRFKLFHSSLSRQPKTSPINKQRDNLLKKARILNPKHNNADDQGPPREYLGRRARDNAQELLIHLVSFAMDSLTIEIWLNVKCMTFCARACRVTREGQTNLLDQVTFSSHLEANGSWSNLMFCFEEQHTSADEKVMNFKVIVNGVHKEKEKLVYSAPKSPVTNFAILIGCERSTFGYVWKLSQINIYKNIPDKSMPIYLLGKGPDFWSFTNFRQQSLLPLPDITQRHMKNVLQPKVLMRYSTIDEDQALNWLTQNIVISYVAHQPEHFLDYSLSVTPASIINPLPADYEFSNSAERFIQAKTLDFSRSLKFNQNNGFGSALVESGGIESVLMSFAEVVRRTPDDQQAHALAFSVLLKMSQTNLYHLNKFLDELNGLKLVEYILTHPRCRVSRPMLDSYLEYCLMWHSKSTRCLIKSPKLIYHLMTAWRAWHKDAKVARQLYRRLIKLLQPIEVSRRTITAEHKLDCHYISHNFSMMTQAGGIDILMDVLRECLVSADESPPFINHDLIELIINLISLLIKHPPRLDVMLDIMEFLLFLHPDPKAYVEVTHDRLYYLHPIQSNERERVMFDGIHSNGARTPYSETQSDSEVSSSYDDGRRASRRFNGAQKPPSDSSESGPLSQEQDHFTEEEEEEEEEVEVEDGECSNSYMEHITYQCSRDLTEMIEKCNSRSARENEAKMSWIYGDLNDKYEMLHKLGEVDPTRCSNRNFAIANIADMLASMVKLTSSDPMKILSEALQKHIVDPRKLIILANNESSLVREKVLRLFLYCIRACYSLDLKPILVEYEQKSKSENYNICVPLHLMARQLLKYSTTVRMVQLCYGIIVGVDDFETIDSVCLIFDIEVLNNHLQLNALVLLMQLITKLRQPKDIVSGLQFVHAYIKQLLQLGEETTVSILVKNNLIDCVMSLYFSYVETTIISAHQNNCNNNYAYGDEREATELGDRKSDTTGKDVVQELDRLLLLIVRFFIQNQSTDKMIKSIEELLTHFDLLNTKVPIDYQHILRDRNIKILLTSLRYCRHYVECAKRKKYGGRFFDLIKKSERFGNVLPEAELYELVNIDREPSDHLMNSTIQTLIGGEQFNNCAPDTRSRWDDADVDSDSPDNGDSKSISETDVLKRFKAACALVEVFVTTRDPGSTIKDFERNFILNCLKLLAHYLTEFNQSKSLVKSVQNTLWHRMLSKLEDEKLEKSTFRRCFSELILYLLSPIMSVDARKLFAQQILNNFTVYNLLHMLEENSSDRWNHKVLLVFIKDLIERGSPRDGGLSNGDEIVSDMDEDPELNETAVELRQLIRGLESEVDAGDIKRSSSKRNLTVQDSRLDQQHRAIWLANSAQGRENHRDRLLSLEIEFRHTGKPQGMTAASSLENLTNLTDDTDKFMDQATSITKDVVNDKHEQRKAYLEDVKQSKIYNYHIRQQWLSIIIEHSHERAIWYMEEFYPKSWELNPVEGPSRTRRRLKPCKLKLESRFLRHPTRPTSAIGEARSPLSGKDTPNSQMNDLVVDDWYSHYSPHPLCSLIINNEQSMDSNELRIRMFTTDKIHFNCDCSIIRPNEVCDGEVSIASWCIHFIGERSDDCNNIISNNNNNNNNNSTIKHLQSRHSLIKHSPATPMSNRDTISFGARSTFNGTKSTISMQSFVTTVVEDLWFDEIVEIWDRRYQLQDVGLEIFLTNNMTYLLSFRNNRDREDFKQHLMREQHKMINLQRFNLTTSLNRLSQMWRDGKLTNFDYLTCLNKLAGRSFNDLMQYPIFPFILSNYHSELLDLNDPGNFRNLKKPVAIQNEEREANFKSNYQMSQSSSLNIGALGLTKPYHYGNHYSNSATVLHFLVRLPPFTQMLIQYQDNNFDQPDRTFHAISNTWQLITRDSNTDFKELVPEFFFLPEMFLNIGELDLGRKQNNELVDDVRLPPWCPNSDPRLFTLIHRQALESPRVSENLHHWIDLIFGYKQTGKAAIDAINVFHPATYYGGIDLSGQQKSSSSTAPDSMSVINLTIATRSARSSNPGSDHTSNVDLPGYHTRPAANSGAETNTPVSASDQSPRRLVLTRFHQADIERSALETMIKTYGQMPRQLFSTPMKQRSPATFAQQIIESQLEKQHLEEAADGAAKSIMLSKKIEPMKQVRGLKWGSYVGSPSDNDIIAVKHKRIIMEQVRDYRSKSKKNKNKSGINVRVSIDTNGEGGAQQLSKQSDKFHFCLLTNGDVAILRNNTSLMLDYRADRKSSGIYQLSVPSARYSRRAGLSRVSRMNLFSNMIISRQQFSFLEPIHSPSYQSPESPTASLSSSSLVATLTGSRVKFSLDSLNLVSWLYLDGTIRVKHPAISSQKPSIPLVQANTIVDTMSTCASVPELNLLLVGYNSGSICAHIVSTTYETSPLPRFIPTISTGATNSSPSATAAAALSSSSAAPSAVHFLHTTTSSSQDGSLLGPGRVTEKALTGEPHTAVSLAGKTLQSVRSMNRTTRWLYCHSKRVNCIKINVSFGIVVTSSEDGTSVIWDLNSLTFVRTIDYKLKSLRLREEEEPRSRQEVDSFKWAYGRAKKHKVDIYLCNCQTGGTRGDQRRASKEANLNSEQDVHQLRTHQAQKCYICASGVDLIAISDTLGDIVTVKHLRNREAAASNELDRQADDDVDQLSSTHSKSVSAISEASSAISSASSASESTLTSVLYVHTINGALVNFVDCYNQVTAVSYSNAPEGISINVIVVGMVDGLIRLYSSWDLSRVKEFRVSGLCSPINDVMYTRDSQLMYVAYEDGQMVVLRNKRKGSIGMPKEWIL